MRSLLHASFIVLYLAVVFFGLGPVLFADGSDSERVSMLIVVVLLFAVLIIVHSWLARRRKV
jgi:membrane protein DedA with SNARE-associated domain